MITLILAAGGQERWQADAQPPWPKQLAPVAGQPLLERTTRQLRAYSTDVVVVTQRPDLNTYTRTFDPSPTNGSIAETLKTTRPLWGARTVVLLGDVIYSPWALECIMSNPEPLAFFGRSELRHRPLGRYYELFGLSFDLRSAPLLLTAIDKALGRLEDGRYGWARLREVYEELSGVPRGRFLHDDVFFYPINDWTEDLDSWEDYQRFDEIAVKRGWCRVVD